MIIEAFPAYTPEEVDALSMDLWMTRAVQAEYTLNQLRQIPDLPNVDLLMGVPLEIVEEKRERALEMLKKAQADQIRDSKHRKPGEKGFIDKKQRLEFFEEYERSKIESAFSGGVDIPGEMNDEVDFELPDPFPGDRNLG